MGDQPSYSDPIIIPITITIPDPRPKTATGRWGQLGRSIHPSFDDPGWFQRQDLPAGLGAIQASATQRRFDDPPVTLLPDPPPSRLQEKLDEMISRAERRAAFARKEIEQREYESAAGHLLLGRPFPADVDDKLPQIVQNEAQEEEEEDPHPGRPESDAKTKAATEDKPPSTPDRSERPSD